MTLEAAKLTNEEFASLLTVGNALSARDPG
jgi:hypothetical protein